APPHHLPPRRGQQITAHPRRKTAAVVLRATLISNAQQKRAAQQDREKDHKKDRIHRTNSDPAEKKEPWVA
ncbi:hypothetical protein, partial [Frankia tisae]|uniref:hypothetical protein n=1 Tax=Frankia tisae TaxID=2950104 RepID=UPI0021BEBC62